LQLTRTQPSLRGVDLPKLSGKALITGASGFIGGRMRDLLIAQGLDVVSLRRPGSPAAKSGRGVEARYDDLKALTRIMTEEKPDYIFHVAGVTKGVDYQDFQAGNVLPTRNLVQALKSAHSESQYTPKRFVHFSSLAAYGPSSKAKPLQEDDPRRPIEFYGQSKLESERILEDSHAELPWVILRPGGVYGPGDVDYFNLFREISKGRNLFFGNRERWMSAVYVDDLLAAAVLAAATPAATRKGYFVCDGEPLTWGTFQQTIVDAAGRKVITLNLPEAIVSGAAIVGELATRLDKKPRLFNKQKAIMGAQEAWTCSSAALRQDTGYTPQTNVRAGVKLALDWYRRERWL
jgi:nucleoside-diphosphate-sugar epimerase